MSSEQDNLISWWDIDDIPKCGFNWLTAEAPGICGNHVCTMSAEHATHIPHECDCGERWYVS